MAPIYVKTDVTAAELKDKIKTNPENRKLLVLEFMSQSSEPCKYMKKVLDGTSGNGLASELEMEAEFYELNIANFKQFAQRNVVEALPTFLLLNGKNEVARVVGVDRDELKNIIKKHKANPGQPRRPVDPDDIDEPLSPFSFGFLMSKLRSFF